MISEVAAVCALGSVGGLVTEVLKCSLTPTAELGRNRQLCSFSIYVVLILACF